MWQYQQMTPKNYSIFRWDPGAAGSFIISLSDILRYQKPLSSDIKAIIEDPLIQTVFIPELGNANEYLAAAFYSETGGDTWNTYWLTEFEITKDKIIPTAHISNMLKNADNNALQEYHILYHAIHRADEESILSHLMIKSGYDTHISLVGEYYESRLLQFFKQSSRHGEKLGNVIKYAVDPQVNIPKDMKSYKFYYNEVFTDRDKFNDILKILSHCDATDELWAYAQEYYNKNKYIIEWTEKNWPDVASEYQKFADVQ